MDPFLRKRRIVLMDDFLLNNEGMLGYVFTSADILEEVDIGDGDKPRSTHIN